ncbi:MAG: sigma-70 family RNA polymerase sigma factor [Dehalococcoidia bacterium]
MVQRPQAEEIARRRDAVVELYESRYERVARYFAVRIGSASDAEDLASEVFVRALRTVESFRETGAPLEAWIFRIAHNLAVDYLRRKDRRPSSVPLDDVEGSLVGSMGNPGEALEHREDVEQLMVVFGQLSEAQRQVLALRFGLEMTSEQVAQVIGKRPGAVREMQSAAIKKLRQLLAESTPSQGAPGKDDW